MPIIDIPYFYQANAVLPGSRKIKTVDVLTSYPFEYSDTQTDPETVVEWTAEAHSQRKQSGVYYTHEDKLLSQADFIEGNDTYKIDTIMMNGIREDMEEHISNNPKCKYKDNRLDLFGYQGEGNLCITEDYLLNHVKTIISTNKDLISDCMSKKMSNTYVMNSMFYIPDILQSWYFSSAQDILDWNLKNTKHQPYFSNDRIFNNGKEIKERTFRGDSVDDIFSVPVFMVDTFKSLYDSYQEKFPETRFKQIDIKIDNPEVLQKNITYDHMNIALQSSFRRMCKFFDTSKDVDYYGWRETCTKYPESRQIFETAHEYLSKPEITIDDMLLLNDIAQNFITRKDIVDFYEKSEKRREKTGRPFQYRVAGDIDRLRKMFGELNVYIQSMELGYTQLMSNNPLIERHGNEYTSLEDVRSIKPD